ncbi:MAG: hypothetical protein C0502_11935, partial [Opitutus sp.]|nr:hypothetical protein [Opitutus sp.]
MVAIARSREEKWAGAKLEAAPRGRKLEIKHMRATRVEPSFVNRANNHVFGLVAPPGVVIEAEATLRFSLSEQDLICLMDQFGSLALLAHSEYF